MPFGLIKFLLEPTSPTKSDCTLKMSAYLSSGLIFSSFKPFSIVSRDSGLKKSTLSSGKVSRAAASLIALYLLNGLLVPTPSNA